MCRSPRWSASSARSISWTARSAYAAGSEDDDVLSLISAAAGRQADELGVARDDELQIPADVDGRLTGSSVESLHVVVGKHAMAFPSGVVGVVAAQRVQLVDQLLIALNGHDDGRGLAGGVGQDDVACAGGHLIDQVLCRSRAGISSLGTACAPPRASTVVRIIGLPFRGGRSGVLSARLPSREDAAEFGSCSTAFGDRGVGVTRRRWSPSRTCR